MDNFMKTAFDTLVQRGVITSDKLEPSNVTDESIQQFEQEMDIKLPVELQSYLKSYHQNLTILGSPLPLEYLDDPETMTLLHEKTPEELVALDEDIRPEVELVWSQMLAVPKEDPLLELRKEIEFFRELTSFIKNEEVTESSVKQFIPIADWFCAGPLCLDTTKTKEDLDYQNLDTWQLRWFDHEEMDWKKAGYLNKDGVVVGQPLFPDFETFIKLYFYGICDPLYEQQLKMEGEELPDKSTWHRT